MGLELEGAHEAELNFWRQSPFLEKGLRPTLGPPRFKGSRGMSNAGAKGVTRQHEAKGGGIAVRAGEGIPSGRSA